MPQTLPDFWYSFQPEPDRYPRTTHSMARGVVRRTSIDRPRSSEACGRSGAGNVSASVASTWWGTIPSIRSNQNPDNWFRTLPLSGIPLARM